MHKQDNQYQVKFFEMSQTTTELNKQKEHPFQTDVAGGHAEQVSYTRVNPALGVLTFGSITCKFKKLVIPAYRNRNVLRLTSFMKNLTSELCNAHPTNPCGWSGSCRNLISSGIVPTPKSIVCFMVRVVQSHT